MTRKKIRVVMHPHEPEYRCKICGLRFNEEEWYYAIVATGRDEDEEVVRMFFHEDCFLAKKTQTPLMRALIPWEMYMGVNI